MAIDRVKTKANAEKALKAGKILEAIRELQKLADDNPRDIQVLNQIGQLHLRQGNKDLAVPCFLKVADLFSKSGFFTKAVASLKIVTREAPENLAAWEMLAGLSEQQGFAREALTAYEKVGELCARAGNLNGIIEVEKKLLEFEPDNLKVQVQLGDNLIKAGRKEEGVKHYLKAGGKLIAQGHVKEAARMYERALQLDPTNFNALDAAVKTHLAHQQGELALQLLDSLLERSPGADGILLLKADVLSETRQFAAAEALCRTLCAARPDNSGAMFRLVRALVMQQRMDEASGAVEGWFKLAGPARAAEVEALYEEILRFSAGHLPSLKGLVDVARSSKKPGQPAKALWALAESAAAQNSLPLARDTFQELVQLDPANLQAAERLHAVERTMGLDVHPVAPSPPAPEATVPPPQASAKDVAKPQEPDLDLEVVVEETGEAEIDIDMDDLAIEAADVTASLSRASEGAGKVPEEEPPHVPAEESFAEMPRPVQETVTLSAREADDIREQFTEAEVFLKYGLVEKAIAELQGVLKKVPDHIHAHQKLIAIFRNQKKEDKVIRQMIKLAGVFKDQGDLEKSTQLVEEARAMDSGHKALLEWDQGPVGGGSLAAAVASLSTFGIRVPVKPSPPAMLELDVEEPKMASGAAPALEPEEIVLPAETEATGGRSHSGGLGAMEDMGLVPEPQVLRDAALSEKSPEGAEEDFSGMEMEGAEEAPSERDSASDEGLDLGLDLEVRPREPSAEGDLAEHLEEAEFYLNQELYGEAQRALGVLETRWPDDSQVLRFRGKLVKVLPELAAAPKAEPGPSPAPTPMEESPKADGPVQAEAPVDVLAAEDLFAAEDSGEQDRLALVEELVAPAEQPALPGSGRAKEDSADRSSVSRSRARMKVSVKDLLPEEAPPAAEEPLFKENEYYDLASELGAALDGLQAPEEKLFEEDAKSPEEMSFEEVFEEFKKGVEKKVSEDDYATHYNLGIAYKEMELLDEAIGEFQLAARAPQFFVECCSMLGICFRQKGLTELAEKWYRKGIAAPGFAEEVYVGLKYDLADCLADQGRTDEARALFTEVYAIQSSYRDVKARIKQLG